MGLIVVTIVGCVIYFVYYAQSQRYNARNYNFNINTNSNSNDNSNLNSNTNDNSSSTNTSSMSEDDKHKLYQAASMTGDGELLRRVTVKIGLMDEDFTPGPNYQTFVAEHVSWAISNTAFIRSLDTPEKARTYVNENFPD